jgi:DNA-binding transcriptional LysR family regulator
MITDWDDLRVFLTLARTGSLTAAARRLDVSHPTISRRVRSLEQAIGARLFDRLPDRFVPTAAAEELLAEAELMERAAEAIHRRSAGLTDTARGTVRLSAGESIADFLTRRVAELRRRLPGIEFELVASHTLANLSRREADLLIRDRVPDLASLITRRLGCFAYAVYGQAQFRDQAAEPAGLAALPWIGFDEEHAYMPGQRWVLDLLGGRRPEVRTNNGMVLRDAARAGAGVAVLPCAIGDDDPVLVRLGEPLAEVAVDQWLLVHRDLRALPRVRAVMDVLVQLFHEERHLIEGKG